jgi:hypothetical protein
VYSYKNLDGVNVGISKLRATFLLDILLNFARNNKAVADYFIIWDETLKIHPGAAILNINL